jgi:RNA polymerase-binding transcription factor DksA
MSTFCDYCGLEIPKAVLEQRSRGSAKPTHSFCNRDCQTEWQKATGHFKHMSEVGKEKRVVAVRASNKVHPRRAKHTKWV